MSIKIDKAIKLNINITSRNTKYFLTKVIAHYFRISGIECRNLFSNSKINLLTNDYASPQVNKTINLINHTRNVINAVNDAYNALDDKEKPFIRLTAKKFSNVELADYFNKSTSWVEKHKKQAFIKFATNLENSKVDNNCVKLPSLVVYFADK